MPSPKRRFFIALLPPEDVQIEATKIKQYFADVYESRAALRSPPHVTLQPPFDWEVEVLPDLVGELERFARSQFPIPMTLEGFAAFKPRVIYINVLKTSELLRVQKALMSGLETSLNIVHHPSQSRPFSPHLTVGFRDLTKANFYRAWSEFKTKEFYYSFVINHLTLLIHNGKVWEIYQEFSFNSKIER